jgi:hypothetical protein
MGKTSGISLWITTLAPLLNPPSIESSSDDIVRVFGSIGVEFLRLHFLSNSCLLTPGPEGQSKQTSAARLAPSESSEIRTHEGEKDWQEYESMGSSYQDNTQIHTEIKHLEYAGFGES